MCYIDDRAVDLAIMFAGTNALCLNASDGLGVNEI